MTCVVCGCPMSGRRPHARTCSGKCREAARRKRQAQRVTEPRHSDPVTCDACGRPLHNPRARACSNRCKLAARRRTWAELRALRWELKPGDFWRTPDVLFESLDDEFRFTLDAATAGPDDAKCRRYLTPDDDALVQSWRAHAAGPSGSGAHVLTSSWGAVFCNPPYSQAGGGIGAWVDKALEERAHVDVVLVLPLTRTTAWARKLLEHADEIRYPTRRVAFVAPPGLAGTVPRHETMVPILRCGGQGPARELSWDLAA